MAAWLLQGPAASSKAVVAGLGAVVVTAFGPRVLAWLLCWVSHPRRGDLASDLRDALFVAGVCVAATAVGVNVAQALATFLPTRLEGSVLSSAALPASTLAGLATTILMALLALAVPGASARQRLAGRIDGQAAGDVMLVGAGGLWVTAALITMLALVGSPDASVEKSVLGWATVPDTISLHAALAALYSTGLPVALASLCGYALPRLLLAPRVPPQHALWVVLADDGRLPANDATVLTKLTRLWPHGPVVWVVPPDLPIRGEHAALVWRLGQWAALHPQHAGQLGVWLQGLPPVTGWNGLCQREIHPVRPLLQQAVRILAGADDAVVLLTRDAQAPEAWLRALPGMRLGVGWLEKGGPRTVAGSLHAASLGGTRQECMKACASLVHSLAPTVTFQVFISYADEYRSHVDVLVKCLDALGVKVWFDGRLHTSEPWDGSLRRMLEQADAVVTLVGPATAKSAYQLDQIDRAAELKKLMIPVVVSPFNESEPKAVLEMMAANVDASGRPRYLSEYASQELGAALQSSAERIVAAILHQTPVKAKRHVSDKIINARKLLRQRFGIATGLVSLAIVAVGWPTAINYINLKGPSATETTEPPAGPHADQPGINPPSEPEPASATLLTNGYTIEINYYIGEITSQSIANELYNALKNKGIENAKLTSRPREWMKEDAAKTIEIRYQAPVETEAAGALFDTIKQTAAGRSANIVDVEAKSSVNLISILIPHESQDICKRYSDIGPEGWRSYYIKSQTPIGSWLVFVHAMQPSATKQDTEKVAEAFAAKFKNLAFDVIPSTNNNDEPIFAVSIATGVERNVARELVKFANQCGVAKNAYAYRQAR